MSKKLSTKQKEKFQSLIDFLNSKKEFKAFRKPVDKGNHYFLFLEYQYIEHYLSIIKHPMDFETLKEKLNNNEYKTTTQFKDDLDLIWFNCQNYNIPGSKIFSQSEKLFKMMYKIYNDYIINKADKIDVEIEISEWEKKKNEIEEQLEILINEEKNTIKNRIKKKEKEHINKQKKLKRKSEENERESDKKKPPKIKSTGLERNRNKKGKINKKNEISKSVEKDINKGEKEANEKEEKSPIKPQSLSSDATNAEEPFIKDYERLNALKLIDELEENEQVQILAYIYSLLPEAIEDLKEGALCIHFERFTRDIYEKLFQKTNEIKEKQKKQKEEIQMSNEQSNKDNQDNNMKNKEDNPSETTETIENSGDDDNSNNKNPQTSKVQEKKREIKVINKTKGLNKYN